MSLQNTYKINDIEYYYNIMLVNKDGSKSALLTQSTVKLLVIDDDVCDPFTDSYIIIDNNNNVIQRRFKVDGVEMEELYDFNVSENDYVYVEIVPKLYKNQEKDDINPKVWNLQYIFVITDVEELDGANQFEPNGSLKKMYLTDYQKFEMMDNTSFFSTANIKNESEIAPYLRDDTDRLHKTGDILKEIIKGAIDNPEFDEEEWDQGSNRIFYTSPVNNTYLDDFIYVYNLHQGSIDNDFCIIEKERYTELWHLEKFSDIMSKALNQTDKTKAGERLMEAFIVADTAENPIIPKQFRVPTDFDVNRNVSFGDLSKIENFKLYDISRETYSNNIMTNIAHSYDFENGKFKIEHYDITDIKKFYDDNYVSKLKSQKSLFKVIKNREENKKLKQTYAASYEPENTHEFISRNIVLKSHYIMNLGIEFEVTGMTNRQAGKFFSIYKTNNYYDSSFEDKLQGIWFCTDVKHIFTETSYQNQITGVKINLS